MTRPALLGAELVVVLAALAAVALAADLAVTNTRTVTRPSPACTRQALLAEQNELDWQRIFQAHVDVENEALDGTTLHSYRRHLAAIPGPPSAIDLGSCS